MTAKSVQARRDEISCVQLGDEKTAKTAALALRMMRRRGKNWNWKEDGSGQNNVQQTQGGRSGFRFFLFSILQIPNS